jgi:hypothetical protein
MGWERSGDSLSTGPIHRSLSSCAWDPSLVEGSKAAFHKGGTVRHPVPQTVSGDDEAPGPMPPGQREFTLFSWFQRNTGVERPLAKRAMRQFMPRGINPPR